MSSLLNKNVFIAHRHVIHILEVQQFFLRTISKIKYIAHNVKKDLGGNSLSLNM